MKKENNTEAFLALVRVGLWADAESENLGIQGFTESVDWEKVYQLAKEQSVQGLVLQGLEWFKEHQAECVDGVPQELLLQWIGEVQLIDRQNKAMNEFVAELVEKLRKADIHTLLVKGQGIAQCYARPMWRASGDVDLYLSESNYKAAKEFLIPLASYVGGEDYKRHHLDMTVDSWTVELHGTMHSDFSKRMNKALDDVHQSLFYEGEVRCWINNGVSVFLPSANNDAIIIFTHIIQHFYVGGIGLRQICDWCRLLWKYRKEIDVKILESKIRKAGLMSEWIAFAALAVEYLGMPVEAMPLYSDSRCYRKKAERIKEMILKAGNFGHSINDESYREKYSGMVANIITFFRRLKEFARLSLLFPKNGPKFFVNYVLAKMK